MDNFNRKTNNLINIKTRLLLVLVLLVFNLKGQDERFVFQTLEQQLSNKYVRCVFKDNYGFMWFGTYNGLNKYDGTNTTVYEHNPTNKYTIPHNSVNVLTHDIDSNLWVGTSGGISIYNRQTDNFNLLLDTPGLLNQMNNSCIVAFYQSADSAMWIGTLGGGLNIYNQRKLSFDFLRISSVYGNIQCDYITRFCPDTGGRLWVGTRYGLFLVDINKRKTISYINNGNKQNQFINGMVTAINRDNDGSIWVVTVNNGLQKLVPTANNYYVIDNSATKFIDNKVSQNIKTIAADKHNRLWIGTENFGLYIFNQQHNTLQNFLPIEFDNTSIASNSIWSVYIDNNQLVWIGTYNKGVCLYDNDYEKFETHKRNPLNPVTLADNDVIGFIADNDGNVWVATDGGGVDVFNPSTKKIISSFNTLSKNKLSSNAVKTIVCAPDNTIYIGTWGAGVDKITPDRKKVVNYKIETETGIGNNNLFCLYYGRDGNLWAGTAGSGLFIFNKLQNKFIQPQWHNNNITVPENSFITAVTQDSDTNTWVTSLYGVFKLTPSKNGTYKCTAFFYDRTPGCISSNTINTVYHGSDNRLWFGTFDNGISYFDKKTSKFINYTIDNGLVSNTVNGILDDNNGNLFVSSNKGLTIFNPDSNKAIIYTKNDGLASNEFYVNSALKLKNGELYFGSDNGFNCFFPSKIKQNKVKPIMYLTGLKINNKQVQINQPNSVLKKHISQTKQITLNHTQTMLTISYVGVNYCRADGNKYQYKMEGIDNDWVDVGNYTSASYSNIAPGKYRFLVRGANSDGIYSQNTCQLIIDAKPPVWKTWWAFVVYYIIITIVIFIIVRSRFEKVRAQNTLKLERVEREKDRELNKLKIQFFTNISHEIRTPLTLIIAPLETIINSPDINTDFKSIINRIYFNANRLMRLVNEILDFSKIENAALKLALKFGNITDFVKKTAESFTDLAVKQQITFICNFDDKHVMGYFDSPKLEKIILNLLSNAFKFTDAGGTVTLILKNIDNINDIPQNVENKSNTNWVSIIVSNTGKGIPNADIPFVFDRFFQSASQMAQGSGIGLALVKSLVELNKGTVEVQSIPNKETCFIVKMPIGRESFNVSDIIEIPVSIDIQSKITDITNNINQSTEQKNTAPVHEVLIVEDNDELREYLINQLSAEFKILAAKDGAEAVEMALEFMPDLVLSDIMMPRVSGIELCRILRNDIKTSHVPIILLTAKTKIDDQIEGIEEGADIYITKPFSIKFLIAQIKQLIYSRQMLSQKMSKEVHIMPAQLAHNKIDQEFLQTIVNYVTGHITDTELSVESLADTLNLSRSQIYKKIKAITGQTAVDFIRSIRLKQALKIIETRQFTLAEVAFKTGFSSPSYFTRSFKDYYGKAPSEFLKDSTN